ncbi:MAG: hypothetical protein AB7K71_24055 [Polyangiaceae bacterium]
MTAEAIKPGVVLVARYRIDGVDEAENAFQATDLRTNSPVVLYRIDDREADALDSVVGFHGPDLFELVEVVRLGGDHLAACEPASGATLSDVVSERGSRPGVEGVRLILPVAATLAHLHRSNAVHGSVTPQTVLLGKRARLAFRPGRRGASAFRCPERNAGGGPSARDDAWALAACLYYTLVGEPPTRSGIGAPDELYLAGIEDQQLRTILFQGLATARVQRVASAEPLRAALEQWLAAQEAGGDTSVNPLGGKLTEQMAPSAAFRRPAPSVAESLASASTERAGAGVSAPVAPGKPPSLPAPPPARPRMPSDAATQESPVYDPAAPPARRPDSVRPPMMTSPGIAPSARAPGTMRPSARPRPPAVSRGRGSGVTQIGLGSLKPPVPPAAAPAAPPTSARPSARGSTLESPKVHEPPKSSAKLGSSGKSPPPRPDAGKRKLGGTLVMPDGAKPAPKPVRELPGFSEGADDQTIRADLSTLLAQMPTADAADWMPRDDAELEDETQVMSDASRLHVMRPDPDATNRLPASQPPAGPSSVPPPVRKLAPPSVPPRPASSAPPAPAPAIAPQVPPAVAPPPPAAPAVAAPPPPPPPSAAVVAPPPPPLPPPGAAAPPVPPPSAASASAPKGFGATQPLAMSPFAEPDSSVSVPRVPPVASPSPLELAATAPAHPSVVAQGVAGQGVVASPSLGSIVSQAPPQSGGGAGRWIVMVGGLAALAAALVAAWFVFVRKPAAEPVAAASTSSSKLVAQSAVPAPSAEAVASAEPAAASASTETAPEPSAAAEPEPSATAEPEPSAAAEPEPKAEPKAEPVAAGDVSACVQKWLPADTFRKPPNMSFMCDERDPRKGALELKKRIIIGAGGKTTQVMRLVARLGWYEMASYATLRDACCSSPEPIYLPDAAPHCKPMPEVIAGLSKAVRDQSGLESALDAFAKNALCEAGAGKAGAYWMRRAPGGQERGTFENWVKALRR